MTTLPTKTKTKSKRMSDHWDQDWSTINDTDPDPDMDNDFMTMTKVRQYLKSRLTLTLPLDCALEHHQRGSDSCHIRLVKRNAHENCCWFDMEFRLQLGPEVVGYMNVMQDPQQCYSSITKSKFTSFRSWTRFMDQWLSDQPGWQRWLRSEEQNESTPLPAP